MAVLPAASRTVEVDGTSDDDPFGPPPSSTHEPGLVSLPGNFSLEAWLSGGRGEEQGEVASPRSASESDVGRQAPVTPEVFAGVGVGTEQGAEFVVSISARSGFRRLHKVGPGACWRLPGVHFQRFEWFASLERAVFHEACCDCWPAARTEAGSSHEAPSEPAESSSADLGSEAE